jgi:hypothetical protein
LPGSRCPSFSRPMVQAPSHRVQAAFGVACDRLAPSLDPASARLGSGSCEIDGVD